MTEAPVGRPRLSYIPTFDGMRGFWVVLGPLLYHGRPNSIPGGPDIVPGGILSLDLFFVLSSYLIVTIALREWQGTGRIDVVAYAGRRVRRLFPALFLVVAFLSLYLAVIDDPDLVSRWTGAIVSALTYSANWHEIAAGVSYFEGFRAPSPLKHVWSFSIEEQFYLFAPMFLIAGLWWGGRRGREILLALSVMGALGSAWWMQRVHVEGEDPSRAYYGTDTRAQALFVGIAMALIINIYGQPRTKAGTRFVALLAYPATAVHLWAVLFVSERDAWLFEKGGFLLVAIAAGVALWGMSQPAPWSPLHSLFASPPFRYAGRISYGLYLFHWPVYLLVTPERAGALFGTDRLSGWSLLALHLSLTVAISIVSFHVVEQPFVKRTWPVTRRPFLPTSGALAGAALIVVTLAGLLWANTNRPTEIEQVIIEVPVAATPDTSGADDGVEIGDGEPIFGIPNDDEGVVGPTRILVVGDSVSAQIGWALHYWGEDHPDEIVVFNESHLGCPVGRWGEKRVTEEEVGPVGEVCSSWAEPVAPHEVADAEVVSWITAVDLFQPDIVLGIVSAWDLVDRIVPGVADDWTSIGDPAYDAFIFDEYTEATDILSGGDAALFWLDAHYLNREVPDDHAARVDGINSIIVDVVAQFPEREIQILDYGEFIGPVGEDRDLALRDDGVHLDQQGVDEVSSWLLEQILPEVLEG